MSVKKNINKNQFDIKTSSYNDTWFIKNINSSDLCGKITKKIIKNHQEIIKKLLCYRILKVKIILLYTISLMVIYNCELCNFSSVYSTRYREHCLTIKHLRSLDKIENEKSKVCGTQLNPIEPQMNPIEPQKNPIKPELNTHDYKCQYCKKSFSTNSHMRRHERKTCKTKLKLEDEVNKLKSENEKLKNKSTMNTTTNNIQINTYIKNDKVLNYLNSNFPEAIEMDSFIYRLKNDTSLPREMMDCFVMCYNNGGTDSFGSTLVKYLNQICKQLDINIFPLCCSDSNLRSHKEKNSVGWETVIDTTKIEDIIHHLIKNIFLETGDMIHLDAKERKKICNIVKKSYGLSSIEMIENLETNTNEIYIPIE